MICHMASTVRLITKYFRKTLGFLSKERQSPSIFLSVEHTGHPTRAGTGKLMASAIAVLESCSLNERGLPKRDKATRGILPVYWT
jgi:hypothetical protein